MEQGELYLFILVYISNNMKFLFDYVGICLEINILIYWYFNFFLWKILIDYISS